MRRGPAAEPTIRRGQAVHELFRELSRTPGVTVVMGWAISVDSVIVTGPGGRKLLVWVSQPDDEPARYWADVPGGEVNDYLGSSDNGVARILGMIRRRVGCHG